IRLLLALSISLSAAPSFADDLIVGRASVVDGDTLDIRGERIRLNGIDAPEAAQRCTDQAGREYRCGKVAAFALDEFLSKSRPTSCAVLDHDRYGRAVADCVRADGLSVASWLVRSGHALDWRRYSGGRYAADEATARANRAGIWQGDFQQPCEYRAEKGRRKPSC
ncbi:MAG: thermonuclease family protein, partial [Brevundimonas sp.]